MESDGIPIWETFLDIKKEWVLVERQESKKLEETYLKDCVSDTQEESLKPSSNKIV
jgi:hypothetical protein